MKTLFRLVILLLIAAGVAYFFTFRMKGSKVEIEMKKKPGLQEIAGRAEKIEKKAVEEVKKVIPGKGPPQDEPSEEDRSALKKILREKLKEND